MSDRTFDWSRIVLLALAVAGLLVSVQLVRMHAGDKVPDVLTWACGGKELNCDKVLQSGYARLTLIPPRKVPVAVLGAGYFTFMGLWLLMTGRLPARFHKAWAIPALIGLASLGGSVFMIYVMAKIIQAWCGLCLATHVINLLMVVGIWLLWLAGRRAEQPDESLVAETSQLWKIPVLVVITGLAIGLAQVREAQSNDAIKALETESAALDRLAFGHAKKVDIAIDADDPVRGPADARHTVVVFSDFQCPSCAHFAPLFHQVQKALSPNGDLSKAPFRLVFKNYPLNPACNPGRKVLLAGKLKTEHPYACEAAAAAEAARRLGGNDAFWKMHDLLFANQAKLADQPYKQLAVEIGLNGDEFEKLLQDPQVRERISRDAIQGNDLGVRTTPTVFLDGKRVDRPVKTFDSQQMTARTIAHWKELLLWASLPAGTSNDASAFDEAVRQMQPSLPASVGQTPATMSATQPVRVGAETLKALEKARRPSRATQPAEQP